MTQPCEIHAQIGEVKIGRPGDALHAILGSCVGIGFLFRSKSIYGLAHCLLSDSHGLTDDIGARHVDQAINSLVKLMGIKPDDRRGVHVVLAGGGNMTLPIGTDPKRLVGSTNATFAKKTIRQHRFRLIHDDLGGTNARKVIINCTTGEFEIRAIPRLGAVS